MIRKKPAPHLMRGVKRFSEEIMPNRKIYSAASFGASGADQVTTRLRPVSLAW